MKILLFVLAALAVIYGFLILEAAKSAIHEIEAFVLFIVGAVLFSGSAIVGAVNHVAEKLERDFSKESNTEESEEPKEQTQWLDKSNIESKLDQVSARK